MNLKYIILFVVLIVGGILIFIFTSEENKDTNTTTTTNTNTGLGALNLGNLLGGLFGGSGGGTISQDNSFVNPTGDPRTGNPEPRGT